jgi:hypothetical protein
MAKNPLARRRIRIVAPLLATVVALLLVWVVSTVWATFNPSFEVALSSTAAGENTSITTDLDIVKADVNQEATIDYTPPEWFVAADADVTDGATVGALSATATLGIALGGQDPCTTTLPPNFPLYDCTTSGAAFTDTGDQTTPPGQPGSWNGYDQDCTGQGNGQKQICEYPHFLDVLFPQRPLARYCGFWTASGLSASINFLVFEPGTVLPISPAAQTEAWGYPSVSVLNNTGAAWGGAAPGALADFCTPLSTTNLINAEASDGAPLRTNPDCSDTFTFRSYALGAPDADGDGLENGLDTCPFQVTSPLYNPKNGGATGDGDGDGLDDGCDPDFGTIMKADQDDDGYDNAADNCPLIANGVAQAPENQKDTDSDGIGDICDTLGAGPNTVDGARPEVLVEEEKEITGGSPCSAGGGTATATATGTATATATGTGTATATGTATPEGTGTATVPAGEGCAPVIPGTYNGLVRLNGAPAAAGFEVTATIDGVDWGSTIVSGGRYALDVPQKLPASEPCFAGGTITFTIDGGVCEPTEEWASGLHDVDLNCAPAATPTVVPPSTPPVTPPTTPVVTPAKPPVTGSGGLGGDQGLPLWALLLVGWAGLTALAGLGTVATRVVKR